MGWSFRKSFRSGPFRINFSNSGVSYSFGIKGARISSSSKGTYVNLSSHGISYRHKISHPANERLPAPPKAGVSVDGVHHINSAGIERLSDADSMQFVAELNKKSGQISYFNWFGVLPFLILCVVVLISAADMPDLSVAARTDSIQVRVTSKVGVNIRKSADARSEIVAEALYDQAFPLLDTGMTHWVKVNAQGQDGYINRRFAAIEKASRTEDPALKKVPGPRYPYTFPGLIICFVPVFIWLRKLDRKRFQLELNYEMDEQLGLVYQKFNEHFSVFSGSRRIWQYIQSSSTTDLKRNAGAGKLINRVIAGEVMPHKTPLKFFITNITIPYIRLQKLELYFLPERLLIKKDGIYAAVFYKNLQISCRQTRFVEDESLAPDATIIDYTWRYVNKSGGPDRRFNHNKRIPVCNYSEYTISSDTGVYEVLCTSKRGAMDEFAHFLKQIGVLQATMSIS